MRNYFYAFFVLMLSSSLLMHPVSAKEVDTKDRDKVTREANGQLTFYREWVYYWGRNESEKNTKITNAFFREKMDGSGKMMLSDWAENIWSSEFDIENEVIYYVVNTYKGNKWRYSLKKMDLDGENKRTVLDLFQFGSFEVEGKWVYSIGYDKDNFCSKDPDDRKNGIVYRTNLETKKTVVLKKCVYPRLGPITEIGIYLDDEFYPTNSKNPQKSMLKNVWKQIGHKSAEFLEINKDSIFPDRGDIYYIIWSSQSATQYLVKHNEKRRKTTLIKELPKYGSHLRLVNIYREYAYFEAILDTTPTRREIHRLPLMGGELKKVVDIPKSTSFSIINDYIYFYKNLEIVARTPLPH